MPIFFLIFAAVFGLLNLYTWRRCIRRLSLPVWVRRLFAWALAVIFITAVGYIPMRHIGWVDDRLMDLFALSVGAGFVFFAAAVLYDLIRLLTDRTAVLHRRFTRFNLVLDLAVIFLALGYLSWGMVQGGRFAQVKEVEVQTGRMTQPLRIAHLTDLHLGNGRRLNGEFADRVVAEVNRLEPDLVAITGDLIDAPLEKVKPYLAQLAKLQSRYGTFFVLGNHEYFYDADETVAYLESLGIAVLKNRSIRLDGPHGRLEVVGLNDPMGDRLGKLRPSLPEAMDQVDAAAAVLVLAHQPKLADRFVPETFDLMLSGHTHGGQIFPFGLLVRLDQPYLRGLYRHDKRARVYVSAGTGYWGPPLRMFAPSEIALITLR